jgi:hypothetical protein
MNISVTASRASGRRLSVLLGSRPERPQLLSAASGDHYAEILTARIPEHRGAVVHVADDLVLAEFEDAADAVNCAIDIQERFAQYDKLHPGNDSLDARIGIHFGELYFSEGTCKGAGVDLSWELLALVPPAKIYITRDVFVRVRLMLPLKFENVGRKTFSSSTDEKDLFSVAWESVTANLEASLKRLSEDDLQRATTLSSRLGLDASKRASPLVLILFILFLFVLLKALKLF